MLLTTASPMALPSGGKETRLADLGERVVLHRSEVHTCYRRTARTTLRNGNKPSNHLRGFAARRDIPYVPLGTVVDGLHSGHETGGGVVATAVVTNEGNAETTAPHSRNWREGIISSILAKKDGPREAQFPKSSFRHACKRRGKALQQFVRESQERLRYVRSRRFSVKHQAVVQQNAELWTNNILPVQDVNGPRAGEAEQGGAQAKATIMGEMDKSKAELVAGVDIGAGGGVETFITEQSNIKHEHAKMSNATPEAAQPLEESGAGVHARQKQNMSGNRDHDQPAPSSVHFENGSTTREDPQRAMLVQNSASSSNRND
ncbi:unnamed protein product, partial [Amoebophrya sp. A25]|eukprot:GSA25T00011708001.1